MNLSILSATKLNDLHWHRVLIEQFRDEVRFAVDAQNTFQLLTVQFPNKTRFIIGNSEFIPARDNEIVDRTERKL